jgi:hypothetical protein
LDLTGKEKEKGLQNESPTIFILHEIFIGAPGSVVVKALCYEPEGRGFDSR